MPQSSLTSTLLCAIAMSMPFDDGVVIITTISNLMRILAIGFAAVVIGCALIGLRFEERDDDEARPDPFRHDPP
jgi:hypothetical protein